LGLATTTAGGRKKAVTVVRKKERNMRYQRGLRAGLAVKSLWMGHVLYESELCAGKSGTLD